jgi:concanavalin A-like lectin/glucanase superfamily protein
MGRSLNDGLLFYVPFDGDCAPGIARGSKVFTGKKADFSTGKNGKAVKLSNTLKYFTASNIKTKVGTVAFWHAPAWNPADKKVRNRTIFGAEHIVANYVTKNRRFFFMTGRMFPQKGFKHDYRCYWNGMRKWKAGQWQHIAFSWDSKTGQKKLYINGKLVRASKTKAMPGTVGSKIIIGANAPGLYDELFIWDREISQDEVNFLYSAPEKAALKKLQKSADVASIKFELKPIPVKNTIVSPGEAFTAIMPVRNPSMKKYSGKVVFTLRDFWMKDCGRKQLDLKLAPGEAKTLKIKFIPKQKGIYKVEVKFMVNGKEKIRDLSSFASYPEPPERDPDSFFGNHINAWSDKYLSQAARLGQTWQRNHNMVQITWWDKVQPDPGEFTWSYDYQLKLLKKYKMPLLGQIFTTPYWASYPKAHPKPKKRRYSKSWNPNLKYLDKYVYETVKRYKGYIKYWEIWNEPAVSLFWKGTPEEFGKVVQTAIKAAKRADPSCIIMSAGYTCPAWVWHEKAAKAGAFKNLDIISFHYGCYNDPPVESYAKLNSIIEHFQEMALKYGSGKRLPVWSTEGCSGSTTFLRGLDYPQLAPENERIPSNWRNASIRTVQGEAILMSLNVEKHFIYLQNMVKTSSSKVYSNTSMLDVNTAPRPKLMARIIMQDQLDWTEFRSRVFRKKGRFWANVHQKKKSKGSVVLMWCGDKGKLELSCNWPGKVAQVINIMGNPMKVDPAKLTITDEPFYIHVDAGAVEVSAALQKAQIKVIKAPVKLEINDGPDKPKIPVLPDFVAPSENPSGNFTVNIRKQCNMGFADSKQSDNKGGWSDEGPLNDLRDFKTGKQKFYGVSFDVINPKSNNGKSVITMYGGAISPKMPKKVTIPIKRRARSLYFLHAAAWGIAGNMAEYVLNYADGSKQKVVINIPKHCNNWWKGYDSKEISKPVPVRVSNTSSGKPAWRYLRVFELATTKSKVPIKSIELISVDGKQTPIIVAISGSRW